MPTVLSEQDLAHFDAHGYVVVPDAVPAENVAAAVAAIYDFLGADPADDATWYRDPVHPSGNVELYQHPAFWANRQHPRLYGAFADLFRRPDLWVSFDRGAMRPPQRPDQPRYAASLVSHWDVPVAKIVDGSLPFGVQGVLALCDTPAPVGGFTCVPGFHKIAADWIASRPGQDSRVPDLSVLPAGYELVPVPLRAGDLVIWDNKLLHGNGYNVSDRPRLAQYITMFPAKPHDTAARDLRERLWREREAPPWFPGDPRGWEKTHSRTATLTPLGEKLLGTRPWD